MRPLGERITVQFSASVPMTDEQARWQPEGKLIPIVGVVNHLTHVEWPWIDGSLLHLEPVRRDEAEFAVGPDRTLAEVVDAYADREMLDGAASGW